MRFIMWGPRLETAPRTTGLRHFFPVASRQRGGGASFVLADGVDPPYLAAHAS